MHRFENNSSRNTKINNKSGNISGSQLETLIMGEQTLCKKTKQNPNKIYF